MTKKQVTAIIHSFGCEANYQGNRRTMFINGARKEEAHQAIRNTWNAHMPFAVRPSNQDANGNNT